MYCECATGSATVYGTFFLSLLVHVASGSMLDCIFVSHVGPPRGSLALALLHISRGLVVVCSCFPSLVGAVVSESVNCTLSTLVF